MRLESPRSRLYFSLNQLFPAQLSVATNGNLGISSELIGSLAIFGSAVGLCLAALTLKIASEHLEVQPALFIFFRFASGLLLTLWSSRNDWQGLRLREKPFAITRAVANALAIIFYYRAIVDSSLAQATALNMTYPVFVSLIALAYSREGKRSLVSIPISLLAFMGVLLMVGIPELSLQSSGAIGLMSGICAAIGIFALGETCRYNSARSVLLANYGIGLAILLLFFRAQLSMPSLEVVPYLVVSSFWSVIAQWLLTFGMRFVSAEKTSVIGTSRTAMAATIAPLVTNDLALSISGWSGLAIIVCANLLSQLRTANK